MKSFYIFTLILFSVSQFYAQDKGDFNFAILVGMTVSNISANNDLGSSKALIGYKGGVYGDYYLTDSWSLKLKVIYDQKGYANGFFVHNNGSITPTDYIFNTITAPITVNWHFGNNKNWYFNLGPYVGFLITVKGQKINVDVTRDYKSTDFGLAGGIGYKVAISNEKSLFFEIDNQYGLTDILEENSGSAVHNNRLSLNIGIIF